jgi:hypothetical protein
MIQLLAEQNRLTVQEKELLTSGTVNVNQIHFQFDEAWDGLTRTAVFQCGTVSVSLLLDETNTCFLPWEVLVTANRGVNAGVYGTQGEDVVLPTVWAFLGTVREGAAVGDEAADHTLDAYQKLLNDLGDLDGLKTRDKSNLVAAINEVRASATGEFEVDENTMSYQNGVLSVNTADRAEADNTRPITSAAVYAEVGNIEILLQTI